MTNLTYTFPKTDSVHPKKEGKSAIFVIGQRYLNLIKQLNNTAEAFAIRPLQDGHKFAIRIPDASTCSLPSVLELSEIFGWAQVTHGREDLSILLPSLATTLPAMKKGAISGAIHAVAFTNATQATLTLVSPSDFRLTVSFNGEPSLFLDTLHLSADERIDWGLSSKAGLGLF